jgi:hypothetical protein
MNNDNGRTLPARILEPLAVDALNDWAAMSPRPTRQWRNLPASPPTGGTRAPGARRVPLHSRRLRRQTATRSLIPSFGACTRSCLVPR